VTYYRCTNLRLNETQANIYFIKKVAYLEKYVYGINIDLVKGSNFVCSIYQCGRCGRTKTPDQAL
jgi:hypothetical protein